MRVVYSVPSRRRRKKILKSVKGHRGARNKRYRAAKESLMHALQYAWEHRRLRKREFRKLWIIRINNAVREYGLSYSKFMGLLKKKGISINRKALSNMAIEDKSAFKKLVETVMK
ncbi:MAG: 50S ribosomal protein L20 [Spirochaetia bacterium]|nr:50S ribosomal protein L20 [Spirochaetota bacterium]MCX8095994.1 50S ribosomal protein L20 [Spirochaetota bacterium]MDW8112511.1 50S ribosomal protein L20 [Spirochaetia bacterium]